MSKNILKPHHLMIAFVSGTIAGFYLDFNYYVFFIFFAVSLACIILRKFSIFATVACLFLGSFYMQIYLIKTKVPIADGCSRGRVTTIARETGDLKQAGFTLANGQKIALESDSEPLNLYDEMEICFSRQDIKEVSGSYGKYLLSKYQSSQVLKNPDINAKERNVISGGMFAFRDAIIKKTKKIFLGDKGVLATGLILGGSQEFSENFKQAMKDSGTSHLVAVSGYNVSIITISIFIFLRSILSRRLALIISLIVLIFFCVITGATSSVVRASMMGLLYLLSKTLGRKISPLHLLSVAGFVMILINPFAIFDIGFQLSFVATFGLISSIEILNFVNIKNPLAILVLVALETTIAQVYTFPLILYYFGQTSLIALLPNVMILPLVPLAMSLVGIAILSAFINFYLGLFISVAGNFVLSYFIWVIDYFGSIEFAKIELSVPLYAVVIFYFLLVLATFKIGVFLNEKTTRQDI